MAKYSSKAILICVGVAALTAVLLASFYLLAAHPSSDPDVTPAPGTPNSSIHSFEECAQHYPVMESYPERCAVPGGQSFTKQY